jgi:hypothetical protein
MTIRNITAHLTFSLTGGLECHKVKSIHSHRYVFDYLFSNNFFGYHGFDVDKKALTMKSISETYKYDYEVNKIYADEALFIARDYSKLPKELHSIVEYLERDYLKTIDFEYSIKRMYYIFNLETDDDLNDRLTEEIFSKYFNTWLKIKETKSIPNKNRQVKLIFDVLNKLFTNGELSKSDVPITMRRETSITQDVQCMYGNIRKRNVTLELEIENENLKGCENAVLYLYIDGNKVNYPITLPLMDYFNDLLDGAINTDINPLLTQGIDSIKSQCIAYCEPSDEEDCFSLKILHNGKELKFERDDDDFLIAVQ